jgi:hypothetical protein
MRVQPAITFCTQLDKHLVVGSYDQVLVAAANPPVKFYSYFLTSLLETVRINIGECVSSAYDSLTLVAATKILMFENKEVCMTSVITSIFEHASIFRRLLCSLPITTPDGLWRVTRYGRLRRRERSRRRRFPP